MTFHTENKNEVWFFYEQNYYPNLFSWEKYFNYFEIIWWNYHFNNEEFISWRSLIKALNRYGFDVQEMRTGTNEI